MCDTEVYTVRVDTTNTTGSNVDFTSYIKIPMRNVVKAELLTASIPVSIADVSIIYVYVDELVSKFNDRATLQFDMSAAGTISTQGGLTSPISNLRCLETALALVPVDETTGFTRTVFTSSGSGFPTDVAFIEPIRQLKTLTVKLFDNGGTLIPNTIGQPVFLTFRFTCAKPNVCLYPDRGGAPLL